MVNLLHSLVLSHVRRGYDVQEWWLGLLYQCLLPACLPYKCNLGCWLKWRMSLLSLCVCRKLSGSLLTVAYSAAGVLVGAMLGAWYGWTRSRAQAVVPT